MGRKARNAGTTGHRARTCNKLAEKSILDTSNVRVGGRGSRSSNRKANKAIINDRIERINEAMRQQEVERIQQETIAEIES